MDNKENFCTMFDEGYLSCSEIFCETIETKPVAPQQGYRSYPRVLQVKAQVDRTLTSDDRVLYNMVRNEHRYLPSNPDYFRSVQVEIKAHMRKIVADWMLEVCQELCCQPEVFCLAVNLMDRFLARCRLQKSQLQLLGAVCLFLSSKFKETAPIPSEKLVMYTDFSVTLEEIREWELIVLHKLKWDLCSTTALDYLDHIIPKLVIHPSVDQTKLRRQTETIIALTSTHYLFSYVRPSVIASSAIAVALRCLLPSFSEDGARQFISSLQTFSRAETCDLEACSSAMIQTLPAYLTTALLLPHEQIQGAPLSPSSSSSSSSTTSSPPSTPTNQTQHFSTDLNSSLPLQGSFRQVAVLVKSC